MNEYLEHLLLLMPFKLQPFAFNTFILILSPFSEAVLKVPLYSIWLWCHGIFSDPIQFKTLTFHFEFVGKPEVTQ